MSSNLSDKININEVDENYLKNLLNSFYHKIIKTNDFKDFEKISSKWLNYEIERNDKIPKKILELMENHEKSKFWFTSFMGFFYQLGIGCVLDKTKAMELYFSAINNNVEDPLNEDFNKLHLTEKDNDSFKNKNIIIGKYLLSLFYYGDIIYKQNEFNKLLKLAENDDSEAQYNLAIYYYQNGSIVKTNYEKAFKWFLRSAEKGNPCAQHMLGICYMDGKGIQRDEKKACNLMAQSYFGDCHAGGIGIDEDKEEAFE
ncbi:hypothetical protein C1645_870407 [Glomus cerebriforme]|uniref:HCP-like protein n=1 Tax=Glomus cerebriforme TaxID=658196 RepID=A0A397TKM7_9GLOM|nr:hypothetical protein C1645_870407 [Glomus cerebriforme]